MAKAFKLKRQSISHFIAWGILLFLPFISFLYQPQKWNEASIYFAKTHFLNIAFLATTFYFNRYFVAPKYFFKKSRLQYFLVIFTILAAYFLVNYLFMKFSPETNFNKGNQPNVLFFRVFLGPSFMFSLCTLTSTMLFLYHEQAQQKELNRQIELEKTAAELNMLKLQISPHFLFNTLNNIRWQVRKKSEQSEESILKLSEILRYIIYEVGGSKVDLKKEIDHLKNYIDLQTLRLNNDNAISFSIDPHIKNYQIEPLLFIHFVENAFKYGVDGVSAPQISFTFGQTNTGVEFVSKNKILVEQSNLNNEGIGLTNIKRRLELLYPNKHTLEINKDEAIFDVKLTLVLES